MSPEAKDLIDRLLQKDFMSRLGAKGANEIKMHPFFEDVDWENLKSSTSIFSPPNITKFSEIANMKENDKLRNEIESLSNQNTSKNKEFEL